MKQTGIEKVSIRLKSEIDGNTTEYCYSGECQFTDGSHCIAYIDYMGNALTKVGVEANEKMMLLHRVGYVTSDMLFDPEAETIVKYDASSLKSGFVLKTHGYNITEEETKLTICVAYSLIDGSSDPEIAGKQEIIISFMEDQDNEEDI